MSNAKKIGALLILLIGAVLVIRAFSAEKTPAEFRLREITQEEHAAADQFIGELAEYARKGAEAEFARYCENPRNPKTTSSWHAMRKFSQAESKLTGISSYATEPERCRLHLENTRGEIGTAICRRETNGSWRFLSFTFVTPEENQ